LGKDHSEDLDITGWVILKWILEIGLRGMDCIDVAQDRGLWRALVNTEMNLSDPYNFEKFFSNCTTGSFSRRAQLHGVT
jgi:hypothetical protein